MTELDEKYLKSENYVNREMSWLEFDFRILGEARDKAIPLFERLKFLSITSSNLDEFFMVRVASLKDMVHAKYKKADIAGLRADQQLELIGEKTHELVNLQYSTYNRSLDCSSSASMRSFRRQMVPLWTSSSMRMFIRY